MELAGELAGAFVAGAVTMAATIFFVGRRIVRRKLNGFLDLTGAKLAPRPAGLRRLARGGK